MEFTKEQLIAYFSLRIEQANRMGVRDWHGDAGDDARRDLLAYQLALASLSSEPAA